MKEIELKAYLQDRENVFAKLQKSYKFVDNIINLDIYYKRSGDINEKVRLRCRKNKDGESFLATSKNKTFINGVEVNDEIEFELSCGENFTAMMKMLGLVESYRKVKEVVLFSDGDFNYELVHINRLGDFIEIEKIADDNCDVEKIVEDLKKALFNLGIGDSDIEIKTYKELLVEKENDV